MFIILKPMNCRSWPPKDKKRSAPRGENIYGDGIVERESTVKGDLDCFQNFSSDETVSRNPENEALTLIFKRDW